MDSFAPNPSTPALLVFTLGERRESHRRRLLPRRWSALEERLHRTCLEAALEAGRDAGCRLRVSSPMDCELPPDAVHRPQQGRTFGDRLRGALAETFATSNGPIALVGSDIPGLSASHLQRSFQLLEDDKDQVVIGPSPDGGFYLLAAARPLDGALAEVRWCRRDTLRSLRQALARRGRRVVLLEALTDLDHRADLEHWLAACRQNLPWRNTSWHRLTAELHALLVGLCRPLAPSSKAASPDPSFARPLLRGPPQPASV